MDSLWVYFPFTASSLMLESKRVMLLLGELEILFPNRVLLRDGNILFAMRIIVA